MESYYYLIDAAQLQSVPKDSLKSEPLESVNGELFIIESTLDNIKCIERFANNTSCSEFVKTDLRSWDKDYELSL